MAFKTNFSFDIYFNDQSTSNQSQRDAVMGTLEPSLLALLTLKDRVAKVAISESHKGDGNKLVEITTSLPEAELDALLKQFCESNGLAIALLE
jgi:hypothetical protein